MSTKPKSRSKAVKPVTKFAKEDDAITRAHRKVYPAFDQDVIRYGLRVADYNAGWLAGTSRQAAKNVRK